MRERDHLRPQRDQAFAIRVLKRIVADAFRYGCAVLRRSNIPTSIIAMIVSLHAICWHSAMVCGQEPLPDLLIYQDEAGKTQAIHRAEQWAKRRAQILVRMQEVMGPLPDAAKKVPLDIRVVEELRTDSFVRQKITYMAEEGDPVPAYLFLPTAKSGRLPAVVCLQGTNVKLGNGVVAGLEGVQNDRAYAVHLAERGYVTIAPCYVNMGEYKFDAYRRGYASATMKAIWNHMRAVDLLQSLTQVDPDRIGAVGHSLGGHNSMFLAAFDERIKCVVSNCGFCSFARYKQGNLAGWSHDGYMPRIRTAYELSPARMPFEFHEVVAAMAPRPFLASAPLRDDNFDVQGVKDCITAAAPVYALLGAEDRLTANYPDCDHNFPPDVRAVAYAWLDRWLKQP